MHAAASSCPKGPEVGSRRKQLDGDVAARRCTLRHCSPARPKPLRRRRTGTALRRRCRRRAPRAARTANFCGGNSTRSAHAVDDVGPMTGAWSLRRSAPTRGSSCASAPNRCPRGTTSANSDASRFPRTPPSSRRTLGVEGRPVHHRRRRRQPLPLDAFFEIARRQRKTARQRAVPLCRFLMNQARTAGMAPTVQLERGAPPRARPPVRRMRRARRRRLDGAPRGHRRDDCRLVPQPARSLAADPATPSVTRGSFGDIELAVYRRPNADMASRWSSATRQNLHAAASSAVRERRGARRRRAKSSGVLPYAVGQHL